MYRGRHEQLNREVAIKVPRPVLFHTAEMLATYLAEAKALAALEHPTIVPVYDVGSTPEIPCFVVSKLIDGTDLQTRMRQGSLTAQQPVDLVTRIADALHYAHTCGLIHRDVKPANILIDARQQPFLVDFGLAMKDSDLGTGARLLGTPAYMSPEQIRGEGHRVDGRTDIFSLGVVLYELLTGKRPFRSDSRMELMEQITSMDARPLRQICDDIPQEIERVCLKALSKKPTDRYSTARDFAEDLRAAGRDMVAAGFVGRSVAEKENITLQRAPAVDTRQPVAADVPVTGRVIKLATSFRSIGCSVVVVMGLLVMVSVAPLLKQEFLKSISSVAVQSERSDPESSVSTGIGETSVGANGDPQPAGAIGRPSDEVTVEHFEMLVSRNKGPFQQVADMLPLQTGDHIRFSVQLDQPAHVRLIWIDADGRPGELYPQDPEIGFRGGEAVRQMESPVQLDRGWPLEGIAGMETAVLLVSRTPLPDVPNETLQMPRRDATSLGQLTRYEVSRTQSAAKSTSPQNTNGDTRSLGHKSQEVDDAILKLLEKLRQQSDAVHAISVLHTESP